MNNYVNFMCYPTLVRASPDWLRSAKFDKKIFDRKFEKMTESINFISAR